MALSMPHATMIIKMHVLLISLLIARIQGELSSTYGRSATPSEEENMYKGYDNTIPAAPVQGQASSCSLDLSDELLGGVKTACMQGPLDRKHCCPVLAAWLMAARAKVALHPPLEQEPGMPVLPDDSLVCIASLKAALAARGISISTPVSASNASSCDVITCFCGIHLSQITSQSCPLPFSTNSSASNTSSLSSNLPTLPHLVQHNYNNNNVPLQPSLNDTTFNLPTSSSSHPPLASPHAGMSDLLQQLAANCTDHSYRGCTRCLKTLTKEMRSEAAKEIIRGSKEKAKECEMIGLMWLLDVNKTLYIPTVSAVVRALLFNNGPTYKCSLDTDNMPLALDYNELISTPTSNHPLNPPLITFLISLFVCLITTYFLAV